MNIKRLTYEDRYQQTLKQKIDDAKDKDLIYKKYQEEQVYDMAKTEIILNKYFYKDITSIILPYLFVDCSNCKKKLKNYKICSTCKKEFCLECFYDIDFGCKSKCLITEHFIWH